MRFYNGICLYRVIRCRRMEIHTITKRPRRNENTHRRNYSQMQRSSEVTLCAWSVAMRFSNGISLHRVMQCRLMEIHTITNAHGAMKPHTDEIIVNCKEAQKIHSAHECGFGFSNGVSLNRVTQCQNFRAFKQWTWPTA